MRIATDRRALELVRRMALARLLREPRRAGGSLRSRVRARVVSRLSAMSTHADRGWDVAQARPERLEPGCSGDAGIPGDPGVARLGRGVGGALWCPRIGPRGRAWPRAP